MKCILSIDTTNNKAISVGLIIDGKEDIRNQDINYRRAQVVLPLVESLLKEHNLSLKDITEIEVAVGPGSFTGIRVGVTIANTLGFLLKIPINGKKIGEFAQPNY